MVVYSYIGVKSARVRLHIKVAKATAKSAQGSLTSLRRKDSLASLHWNDILASLRGKGSLVVPRAK